MSFTPTGKQGKKNRKDACFQNFWKMSVLFFYSKAKEKKMEMKKEMCSSENHEPGADAS